MDLATVRPTQPDPVWAAVATGMYPSKNGVRSAAFVFSERRRRRRRSAARSLLLSCARSSRIHPRPAERGEHVARAAVLVDCVRSWGPSRDRSLAADLPGRGRRMASSSAIAFTNSSDRLRNSIGAATPSDVLPSLEESFSDVASRQLSRRPSVSPAERPRSQRSAAIGGTALRCVILRLDMSPRLTAVRYEGLDTVGHYYLRYTQPRTFRDLPEEERRRFSQAIDRYYTYIDGEIGASLDALAPGRSADRRLGLWHAAAESGQTDDRSPAWRSRFQRHARARTGRISDGLRQRSRARPSAARIDRRRDADRAVLSRVSPPRATWTALRAPISLLASFTADRPIVFIPSYQPVVPSSRCTTSAELWNCDTGTGNW